MKTNAKQLAAARRAMEVIAAREGISVEEVRREISLAILMAQPRDAGIVSEIPCAGAVPTPEELIAYGGKAACAGNDHIVIAAGAVND